MRLILLAFLFFIQAIGLAQVQVLNMSLTDSSLQIVYSGVDNEILIKDLPKGTGNIKVTGASIAKSGLNRYICKPNLGDSCIFYCYNGSQLLLRRGFLIAPLPEPAVRLGNIVPGVMEATVDEILANTTISIILPDCYYKHSFMPVSYRFRIEKDPPRPYYYSKFNYTAQLTEDQKKLLATCPAGVTVLIDDVSIRDKKNHGSKALSQMIILK